MEGQAKQEYLQDAEEESEELDDVQQDDFAEGSPESGDSFWQDVLSEVVGTLLPAVLIALVIHFFLAQATRVYGESMEPTLDTNDRVIVEKITYRFRPPQRGDIVVIRLENSRYPLIKRIIGLPGETIAIRDGRVYINGQVLRESYLTQPTHGYLPPTRIPPLHYFVLGDNRDSSQDSRGFGPVPREAIVGRAFLRYWPLTEIGLVH